MNIRIAKITSRQFCLLTNNSRLQVNEDRARDVLSCSGFAEERVKGIVSSTDGFVAWHLAIRLNSMFQTVQFPTGVSNLNTSLANVNRDTLALLQHEIRKVFTRNYVPLLLELNTSLFQNAFLNPTEHSKCFNIELKSKRSRIRKGAVKICNGF